MAILNGYLTLAELKSALRDSQTTHDPLYERAIEAASREIDQYCNTQFWQTPTPVARVFRPDNRFTLYTGEFASTTGLIVRTDEDDDGVFETTWNATDYQVEPLTPTDGRPFNRIVAVGSREWPGLFWEHGRFRPVYEREYRVSNRARVEVTAHWGWAAIPAQVEQACQILSINNFKSKDITGGSAGVSGVSIGQFAGVQFRGIRVPAFDPQAEALLQGFRIPVIA